MGGGSTGGGDDSSRRATGAFAVSRLPHGEESTHKSPLEKVLEAIDQLYVDVSACACTHAYILFKFKLMPFTVFSSCHATAAMVSFILLLLGTGQERRQWIPSCLDERVRF